ncbi:hypothetical protein KKC32_01155 [Patescibacteria group bacterium]|nr:hypothetical protein [Patescibacteria group bacterium]
MEMFSRQFEQPGEPKERELAKTPGKTQEEVLKNIGKMEDTPDLSYILGEEKPVSRDENLIKGWETGEETIKKIGKMETTSDFSNILLASELEKYSFAKAGKEAGLTGIMDRMDELSDSVSFEHLKLKSAASDESLTLSEWAGKLDQLIGKFESSADIAKTKEEINSEIAKFPTEYGIQRELKVNFDKMIGEKELFSQREKIDRMAA